MTMTRPARIVTVDPRTDGVTYANGCAFIYIPGAGETIGLYRDAGAWTVVDLAGDGVGSNDASSLTTGTLPIARIGANQVDGTKLMRGTSGYVLTGNGGGADSSYQPSAGGGITFQQALAIASIRP